MPPLWAETIKEIPHPTERIAHIPTRVRPKILCFVFSIFVK